MLPRQRFEGEDSEGAGKRATISINKAAHKVVKDLSNAHYIRQSSVFNPKIDALLKDHGLHLTEQGKAALRLSFSDAVVFLMQIQQQYATHYIP